MTKSGDLSKAKVYKIVSPNTDKVYIGTTTEELGIRFSKHKGQCKYYLKNKETGKGSFYSSSDVINAGAARIELIEDFPCDTLEELRIREGHWIKQQENCVNIKLAGRTAKEYTDDNKERAKMLYQANRENVIKRNNTKIDCDCGAIVSRSNLIAHKKTQKHKVKTECLIDLEVS